MIRTLAKQVKEYWRASVVTPLFMLVEVIMETMIPFLMASIIDDGVNAGDISHIYKIGGLMIVCALIGLAGGMLGGRFGAKVSTGLAKNLRAEMFAHIQTFSFASVAYFSPAVLVARRATDVATR
ncbi:MAG: ABC transporter ATP-binding protein, partial [Lachnospiraceae bacterium]|nr:ABC transporter ATP-binding protein [Lachnospiraceae bacterium]